MSFFRAIAAAACVLVLLLPATSLAGKKGGDDRLIVMAEFIPGEGSDWRPWRAWIQDDGIIELQTPEVTPNRPRLEGQEIRALLNVVARARFEEVDPVLDLPESDDEQSPDILKLNVRTEVGYHEVTARVPAQAVGLADYVANHPQRSDLERFLKIWSRVLREVRPLNSDQTSRLYSP